MRLIDADALIDKIGDKKSEITKFRGGYQYCNLEEQNDWDTLDRFEDMVDDAPTIEPKKGEWIHEGHDAYTNYYRCSCCKHLFGDNSRKHDPYCSHCGADMRG